MCREERVACSNICWGQSSNTEGTPCTTSSNHKIMRDPPNAAPIIQIFKRTDGVWKPLHVMLSYLLLKAITILKSIMIRLIFRDWNITIKYGICRLLLVMSGLSVWRPFIESFQAWRALGSTWERFSKGVFHKWPRFTSINVVPVVPRKIKLHILRKPSKSSKGVRTELLQGNFF